MRHMREYFAVLDDGALAAVVPRKDSQSDPNAWWTVAESEIAYIRRGTPRL